MRPAVVSIPDTSLLAGVAACLVVLLITILPL
jgi:hypothetical protein